MALSSCHSKGHVWHGPPPPSGFFFLIITQRFFTFEYWEELHSVFGKVNFHFIGVKRPQSRSAQDTRYTQNRQEPIHRLKIGLGSVCKNEEPAQNRKPYTEPVNVNILLYSIYFIFKKLTRSYLYCFLPNLDSPFLASLDHFCHSFIPPSPE